MNEKLYTDAYLSARLREAGYDLDSADAYGQRDENVRHGAAWISVRWDGIKFSTLDFKDYEKMWPAWSLGNLITMLPGVIEKETAYCFLKITANTVIYQNVAGVPIFSAGKPGVPLIESVVDALVWVKGFSEFLADNKGTVAKMFTRMN